jgi:hypothetical protein
MKKYILIVFATAILSSCTKKENWIVMDCLGNDITAYRGSESEVQDYCQQHSTPTCQWNYKPG